MASEITSTLAASPVKIQQRFSHDRVAGQPDNSLAKVETEPSGSIRNIEGLDKSLAKEKELAFTALEKKQEQASNEDKLTEKISKLNDYAQNINREIQFSVHQETDRTVVKVIDSETDEVIRQIPSEQVLKIAESMENFSGILLKEQA